MRSLALAAAATLLAAAPPATAAAQSTAADSVTPTVRVASRDALPNAAAPRSDTTATTRDSLAAPRSDADVMGGDHSAVSRRTDDSTQAETIVGGLALRMVTNGAGFVTLADGTEWQIALEDRPQVQQWRPGDRVTVRFAPIGVADFGYILVNARDGSQALVALAQPDVRD